MDYLENNFIVKHCNIMILKIRGANRVVNSNKMINIGIQELLLRQSGKSFNEQQKKSGVYNFKVTIVVQIKRKY